MKVNELFKRLMAIAAVFGLVVFTACDPEEEEPLSAPTAEISIVDPQEVYEGGDLFQLNVDFTAAARLVGATIEYTIDGTSFEITVQNGGISDGIIDLNFFDVANATSGNFVLDLQVANDAELVQIAVNVEDSEGRTIKSNVIDIDVTEVETDNVDVFSATLLYAPTGDNASKTYVDATTGETFSRNDVENTSEAISQRLDFGYAYGATSGAWLSSPSSYPSFVGYDLSSWNTRNTTTFRSTSISDEEYLSATTSAKLQEIFDGGTDEADRKSGLEVGDILAFRLDGSRDGKLGLIKIVEINPGTDNTDYIEIEIVIEQ